MLANAVVGLVARELEDRPFGLRQRRFRRPRLVPRRRILDRELVVDHVVGHAREALGHLHVLARAAERVLAVEVRRLDHQRVAFPAAARESDPLPHALRRLRPAVERDDAHVVNHLGQDHHVARRLHDLIVRVVAGVHHRGTGAAHDDAARSDRHVLHRVVRTARSLPRCRALGGALLSLRVDRRNLAVRRIDDQRRAQVRARTSTGSDRARTG